MNHRWLSQAACLDHEWLGPDSWYELNQYGYPNEVGQQALGVCTTLCPVKDQCQVYMAGFGVRTTIAGGGWFDNQGVFHRKMPDETIDAIAVGAMFGITQAAIRHLIKLEILPSAGKSAGGRHLFVVSEVIAQQDKIIKMMKELSQWEKDRKAEAVARAEKRSARTKGIRRATAERWATEALTAASATR